MMARVVHFEILADEPEKVMKFYEGLFGWTFDKWGDQDYWLVTTGEEGTPGINGGIGRSGDLPVKAVNTIDVDDLDAVLAHVEAYGGKIVVPRNAVPGTGWMAYCLDTEGVLFGLMQDDEGAA